mgnify:FL=1
MAPSSQINEQQCVVPARGGRYTMTVQRAEAGASAKGRIYVANRSGLTLASIAVALFAANAQAAIVAQWLLDEQGISDGTFATDTTGNWNGVYTDGSFFGSGTFTSVTGHEGTPNSAVAFNKDTFIQVDAPPDPTVPNDAGGILTNNDLGTNGWQVEFWMRPDQNLCEDTF